MRICRFDKNRLGVVEGNDVLDVTEALELLPSYRWPLPQGDVLIIIGQEGERIPAARAMDYVGGYSIALDMSIRGPEDRSWRKSFDTFSVLGPWLVTKDEVRDPSNLDLAVSVNGQMRQSSNTRAYYILDV